MIKVVHLGLGPLGQKMVKPAAERGFEIVGAMDTDPAKVGRDLGEFHGLGRPGIPIAGRLDEALQDKSA